MNLFRIATVSFSALAFTVLSAPGKAADNICDTEVLKRGAVEVRSYVSDEAYLQELRRLIETSEYSSYKEFEEGSAKLGVIIKKIPIELGGAKATSDFKEWQKNLLDILNSVTTWSRFVDSSVKTVFAGAIEAHKECLLALLAKKPGVFTRMAYLPTWKEWTITIHNGWNVPIDIERIVFGGRELNIDKSWVGGIFNSEPDPVECSVPRNLIRPTDTGTIVCRRTLQFSEESTFVIETSERQPEPAHHIIRQARPIRTDNQIVADTLLRFGTTWWAKKDPPQIPTDDEIASLNEALKYYKGDVGAEATVLFNLAIAYATKAGNEPPGTSTRKAQTSLAKSYFDQASVAYKNSGSINYLVWAEISKACSMHLQKNEGDFEKTSAIYQHGNKSERYPCDYGTRDK